MIRSINVITGVETQREETQAEKDASAIAVAAELANAPYREIARLEATVTQRRIREMTTDAGKEWVADVEALIATERAKL
jgi:hypothetical protein|tara:strand:- start:578 stop:817 length:240 start_codon:yes stop_codon:yes gene_type:complete